MDKIASFTLDEKQYENVLDLCSRFNMNLSEILRIAIRNAVRSEKDNVPSTYKSVKKGVRLSENDIKVLAYLMHHYNIKSISEACRIALLILVNQYSRNFN